MADARDLKSRDPYRSYRFDPGPRHHSESGLIFLDDKYASDFLCQKPDLNLIKFRYRGVEQLAARRAHNPEVVGSNPFPATKRKKAAPRRCCFFRLNMNEKDLNLRRRERAGQSACGTFEQPAVRAVRREERKAERAAKETAGERSEAGGQVLSPQPNERKQHREGAVFFV